MLCISFVCDSYVLVCQPYINPMYSYVIVISLVCSFNMSNINGLIYISKPKFTNSTAFYKKLNRSFQILNRTFVQNFEKQKKSLNYTFPIKLDLI